MGDPVGAVEGVGFAGEGEIEGAFVAVGFGGEGGFAASVGAGQQGHAASLRLGHPPLPMQQGQFVVSQEQFHSV